MVLRTVYLDENGNEMECYPNAAGNICIRICKESDPDDSNYIALDRDEIRALVNILNFYTDRSVG